MLLLAGSDHQISAHDSGVLRARGVALEFVVAPAVPADVVSPRLGIGSRAVGRVEFVGPDEAPWQRVSNSTVLTDLRNNEPQFSGNQLPVGTGIQAQGRQPHQAQHQDRGTDVKRSHMEGVILAGTRRAFQRSSSSFSAGPTFPSAYAAPAN